MTPLAPMSNPIPARLRWLFAAWSALALVFSASGVLGRLPGLAIPGLIWGTVAVVLAFVLASPSARSYLAVAGLRGAVAFHVLRAPIGAVFLWLGTLDLLHPTFVGVAGWGDIAAGAGALAVVHLMSRRSSSARAALWIWNVVAAVDILVVMFTAQRIILFGPGLDSMLGITYFPLSMLPVWIVPLVLLTHGLIFIRLRRGTAIPA